MCCTPLSYGSASGDGICQNTRQKKYTVIVNAEWKLYFSLVLSFFIFLLFILFYVAILVGGLQKAK